MAAPPDSAAPPAHARMIGDLLLDATDQLRDVFTAACTAEGVTMSEARTLRFVARGAGQRHLAELLGCAPSRVTALLQRLDDLGFLARARSSADRRRHDLAVTPEGTAVLTRVAGRLDATSPLVLRLDDADRQALWALLVKLADAADAPVALAADDDLTRRTAVGAAS